VLVFFVWVLVGAWSPPARLVLWLVVSSSVAVVVSSVLPGPLHGSDFFLVLDSFGDGLQVPSTESGHVSFVFTCSEVANDVVNDVVLCVVEHVLDVGRYVPEFCEIADGLSLVFRHYQ
jgi:hypothetical protein